MKLRLAAIGLLAAVVVVGVVFGSVHLVSSGHTAAQHKPRPSSPLLVNERRVTPDGVTAAWVKAENAKPGSSGWNLENTSNQAPGAIEGYADRVSAVQGETVTLYVSTVAPSFHVEGYRMGWYGGAGGRLVWRSAELPGAKQAPPTVTPGINMVEAHWTPSLTVTLTSAWPPGDYLFKLVGSGNQQARVPLTVRDDASTASYVIQNSVTTWQAYNLWGGYDLYQGRTAQGSMAFADRSRVVSFDRPYDFGFGGGAADFMGNELPLVMMAERLGLDVTYSTDVDLHAAPDRLQQHRVLISLGHDEYWSSVMRQAVETARDHGVNLVFLGANAIYRHIRFEPSPLGPNRHEVDYKSASEDPITKTDPSEATSDWPSPPVPRPESTIIGDMYACNPVRADMVIVDPSSWAFSRTGLPAGARLPGLVGSEYDRYDPSLPGPQNIQILAHSPLTCRGQQDFSDVTYYTAPGGGGVFATGTNLWVAGMQSTCPQGTTPCPSDVTQRVTQNVLAVMGVGPAATSHPSQPNWMTYYPAGAATKTPGPRE
ncbi:MAG TPA: N,N-dimethylformamidase beta subunit family domain-containing protein [Acidimicrobiales bacterium]|nr:N,N-dimethylformamidase beta subunit family domain-containing protein [Acidimicrobiales bacterium]